MGLKLWLWSGCTSVMAWGIPPLVALGVNNLLCSNKNQECNILQMEKEYLMKAEILQGKKWKENIRCESCLSCVSVSVVACRPPSSSCLLGSWGRRCQMYPHSARWRPLTQPISPLRKSVCDSAWGKNIDKIQGVHYSEDEQFPLQVNTHKHGQENKTVKSNSKYAYIHEQYFV